MSADNYYTIKFDDESGKLYALMGFMSDLDQNIPALIREGAQSFDDWTEAASSTDGYSEYGLITEPHPLADILTVDQWREHLKRTIKTAQEHLDWINGKDDE